MTCITQPFLLEKSSRANRISGCPALNMNRNHTSIMPKAISARKQSWNQGTQNHNWRHGFSPAGKQHPFYTCWVNMLTRCRNPKSISYPWYGALGVKVCQRWERFVNFKEDMFSTWSPGLEIDRKESKGDYCLENCRWSNHHDQLRN